MKGRIAIILEMATLESDVCLFADDSLQESRYALKLVGGRFVGHANRRQGALFLGTAKIAYAALQDIGVRKNDLFAGLAAQSRGLDADVLDLADKRVDDEAVAHDERLVEGDRQRCE